jgi:putative nucleotidyltransferase with HDIG domain
MQVYDKITHLLSIISSMREPFDHHGELVAGPAMKLARVCGMPEGDVEMIGYGARMHDIGKLLIRTDLLNAPRKLSDAERTEMQTHTPLGWAIVHQAGYEQTIQDVVRHHHERLDGSGYPDGLRGEQIPVAARIVAICDVYEALTNRRPYRDSYTHNFAMAFIQKDKRKLYDPELVDLFFAQVARG